MWLTEFNYDSQPLDVTKSFYQEGTAYLDRLPSIERYAIFGAFRSDVSNVGPNAAMLSDKGQLTDIGLWYLGRKGSGVPPVTGQGLSSRLPGDRAVVYVSAVSFILLVFFDF